MKKPILFLLLAYAILACKKNKSTDTEVDPVDKVSCSASGKYARTASEGTKRIIGTWKLARVEYGWVEDLTPDLQRLIFKADGTCTVITKDSTYAPVGYTMQLTDKVGYTPLPYVSAPLPVLVAGDTIQAGKDLKYYRVGRANLIICGNEMKLDYGLGVWADASVLTYERESDAQ